jgi:hypothetical protein
MAIELLPDGLWKQTPLSGQGMFHGPPVRPAQWDSLGDAARKSGAVALE